MCERFVKGVIKGVIKCVINGLIKGLFKEVFTDMKVTVVNSVVIGDGFGYWRYLLFGSGHTNISY